MNDVDVEEETRPAGTRGQINSYGAHTCIRTFSHIHSDTYKHTYTRADENTGLIVLQRRSTRNSHLSQKEIKLFPEV